MHFLLIILEFHENCSILILAQTDDEQSDLGSAISSATPSFLIGNRFFGPDFNIDQLRCKELLAVNNNNNNNNRF